jgi:hypothetical protein
MNLKKKICYLNPLTSPSEEKALIFFKLIKNKSMGLSEGQIFELNQ